MTISSYKNEATRVLGLNGLDVAALDPWTRKSIDWLTMLMLSVKPIAESAPESTLPAVRGVLSGGLIGAIRHINRMAETLPLPCPVDTFVQAQAVAMQETPELERETILRFINGHLALWEDLHQRRAMPRKVGS